MLQKNNKLSIIVPFYNEARVIDSFLKKLTSAFNDLDCQYILIDDGSNDDTNNIVKKKIKEYFKNTKYEFHEFNFNKGKAQAIKKGIEYVNGEYTLFIDSDLEYNVFDALELYYIAIKDNSIQIIQGSRYLGGKVQSRKYFFNDVAVRFNTFLFNLLFSQSITDLHTGTKIIKTNLLKKLNLSFPRFGLEIDICSQVAKMDITIFEYGIGYIERSKEDGKKITLIDGLLSYYYLLSSRFIKNDIITNTAILYSLSGMVLIASIIDIGIGKITTVFFFALIGLIMGFKQKIFSLSLIFLFIYIGSFIGKEIISFFSVLFFFIISIIFTNSIKKIFNFKKQKLFTKIFF